MKRTIFTVFCVVAGYLSTYSQIMQASIGVGTTNTRIKIYVRPQTAVNGNIATFQFDVAILSSVTPVPTLSFVGTPAFGSGWVIGTPYVEGGFRHYDLTSAAGGTLVLGANTELEVMQLGFSGGPVTANDVSLVTLNGGGVTTGNALFQCTGAASSNSVAGVNGLYYNRGGVTVTNVDSYGGAGTSSATISGIILPLSWLSFDAVKQGNDALLNWKVSNEETNEHYELQRSLNGTDFVTISRLTKTGTGNSTKAYSYTDAGVNALGSSIVYYRLKQVDFDGRISFSETRIIKLGKGNGEVSIFPNPAKDGFYVNVPLTNTDRSIVKMNLLTLSGQLVKSKEISALLASNYYFDIKETNLAAGQYNLQIILDGKVITTKKLMINQ
jgi:hypothetical protein